MGHDLGLRPLLVGHVVEQQQRSHVQPAPIPQRRDAQSVLPGLRRAQAQGDLRRVLAAQVLANLGRQQIANRAA